jgi:hypothetical protein
MSLEGVYTNQVKGQTVKGIPVIGSAPLPIIERDPNVRKLEQEVFAQIYNIVKPEPSDQEQNTPSVEFVSFEQALRELKNG